MFHPNDVCPVCGQVFSESDDVVHCPDCGAPHHRACWQQNGGCAHAAEHANGYVWHSAAEASDASDTDTHARQAEITRCPRCGEELAADTLVCPECGRQLGQDPAAGQYDFNADYFMRGITADPNADLGGVTVREAAMFTQYHAGAYVRKFRTLQEKNNKIGWNWAAFLFAPYWFFYRKIYRIGLLFMGVMLVLTVFMAMPFARALDQVTPTFEKYYQTQESNTDEAASGSFWENMMQNSQRINTLSDAQKQEIEQAAMFLLKWMALFAAVPFLPNIAAALLADSLYREKIIRDIKSMREFAQNERTFRMLTLRRGGISIFAAMVAFMAVRLVLQFILFYL